MVVKGTSSELDRITASLSAAMLEVSRGPMKQLSDVIASPAGAVASLATISRNLDHLASFASLAASLASMMRRLQVRDVRGRPFMVDGEPRFAPARTDAGWSADVPPIRDR